MLNETFSVIFKHRLPNLTYLVPELPKYDVLDFTDFNVKT